MFAPISTLLSPGTRFRLIDAGSRGDLDARWQPMQCMLEVICFDADADASTGGNSRLIPAFLSERDGEEIEFFITKQAGASSRYAPDMEFWKRVKNVDIFRVFPNAPGAEPTGIRLPAYEFEVDKTVTVKSRSLDSVAREHDIRDVAFMKMDLEGSELDVLRGGQETLKSVVGLEIEVAFGDYRVGGCRFADIDEFVRTQGFSFFGFVYTHGSHYAGRLAAPFEHTAEGWPLPFKQTFGQLVTADAVYFRDPLRSEETFGAWPADRVIKLIIAADVYGQAEFAAELTVRLIERERRCGNPWAETLAQQFAECLTNAR